jgi:YVTN family beta-propeller protein
VLEFNRDVIQVYVNNRAAGTISVVDLKTLSVVATWTVGGSPDEMVLTPDGHELWIANRYNNTATVVDTATGRVTHTIPVGEAPHGILYWPLPGTMSIGQNGNMR